MLCSCMARLNIKKKCQFLYVFYYSFIQEMFIFTSLCIKNTVMIEVGYRQ